VTTNLQPVASMPAGFAFNEVTPEPRVTSAAPTAADLGPLAAFVGDWTGSGFNTIFRPDSPVTPTQFPTPPVPPGTDNVLELNLTSETLSFLPSLGRVPNRGELANQPDVFLNGVPYLQSISDVTTSPATGIHLEPGLWMFIPSTNNPSETPTVFRMASIPHGTTVIAQGTFGQFSGQPPIPPVSITPFSAIDPAPPPFPPGTFRFPSQTAGDQTTPRIPQDLTSFMAAGTITQAILDDPNTVLRNHNASLTIVGGTFISVSTSAAPALFGGGTDNIAFLLGSPAALTNPKGPGQNAQTIEMTATFWIETVQHTIEVPAFGPGTPPATIQPVDSPAGAPTPAFIVRPPTPLPEPRTITVESTQIQYSQTVLLNFNGLSWPHVSVATLVPAGPIPVQPTSW
jgi:hypothetical protein